LFEEHLAVRWRDISLTPFKGEISKPAAFDYESL
jgi:hypothetical protein